MQCNVSTSENLPGWHEGMSLGDHMRAMVAVEKACKKKSNVQVHNENKFEVDDEVEEEFNLRKWPANQCFQCEEQFDEDDLSEICFQCEACMHPFHMWCLPDHVKSYLDEDGNALVDDLKVTCDYCIH